MPSAGILKRLKKVGSQALDIAKSLNNTMYKPMKPLVSDVLAALPGGAYVDKGLQLASNSLDKYGDSISSILNKKDYKKRGVKGGSRRRIAYDSDDDDDAFSRYR